MRTRYIISYDIANPRRLRRVHRKMKDYGTPVQYSVFLCDFSAPEKVLLIEALMPLLHQREDQVLIINIGSATGRARDVIQSLGRAFDSTSQECLAVII